MYKATSSTSTVYTFIGDILQVLSLVSSITFAISVVAYSVPERPFKPFDPTWIKDGFCISNQEIPYWTSHDLCLYGDTALALLCGLLYAALRDKPGMEPANELSKFNILGVLAHGIGHGAIAAALRNGDAAEDLGGTTIARLFSMDTYELFTILAPIAFFWIVLLKASMPKVNTTVLFPLSIPIMILHFLLPQKYQFAYVQTILSCAFSINQLARPSNEKGFEYALFTGLVSLPVCFIGWVESTMCSYFIIHLGGHIIYDFWIPLSTIAFYIISYRKNMSFFDENKNKKDL